MRGHRYLRTSVELHGAAACLSLLLLTQCAILDGTEDGSLEGVSFSGYVTLGFEDSSFLPCSAKEAWWLTWDASTELLEKYDAVATHPHERLFAVMRGDRSVKGSYGHLGGFERTFRVTNILELRKPDDDDCLWPGDEDVIAANEGPDFSPAAVEYSLAGGLE